MDARIAVGGRELSIDFAEVRLETFSFHEKIASFFAPFHAFLRVEPLFIGR